MPLELVPLPDAILVAKESERINRLEKVLAEQYADQIIDCPVVHTFTPGMYSREIFMPKGTLITSKIHKTEHQYVIPKGHLYVYMEDGGIKELKGFCRGITKPGARRAIFTLEDTIWITFHPTNETDLRKLEAQLIEPHDIPTPRLAARKLEVL